MVYEAADHVLLSIAPQLMEALSVDDLEPDDEPGPRPEVSFPAAHAR